MGRRQGDTDLRTLQAHIATYAVERERRDWLRRVVTDAGAEYRRRMNTVWISRPMSLLAFRVMMNEVCRTLGIPLRRYKGK